MNRFRRSSKSSVKSLPESPKTSSPPPQPPQKEWPEHEVELFRQINAHMNLEQETREGDLEDKVIEDAKKFFENVVDPAEEAYRTPTKPGGKDSKITKPARSTDGKAAEPNADGPFQGKQDDDESIEEKTGDGHPKDINREKETAKKGREIVAEAPTCIFIQIIISFTAITLAVILVIYYLTKDLVHVTVSALRQCWERFTATMIITPTSIRMLYKEVFEPLIMNSKQEELPKMNPIKKPVIVITSEQG